MIKTTESKASSTTVWEAFLRRYYWDNLLELISIYPERKSLNIKFSDLDRYDFDLATELINTPDKVLRDANEAIKSIEFPAPDFEFENVYIRVSGLPEKVRRRDIRHELINKLIAIDGVVQRVTEVTPKITVAAFRCMRCDHITLIPQLSGVFTEPFECEYDMCGRKGPFKLLGGEGTKRIDYQKIRVQEPTEDLKGGEKSQTIDIDIYDDIAGGILPGNKVTIVGVLRSYQRNKATGKTPFEDLCIEANYIQVHEGLQTVVVTPEDKKRLKLLAAKPNIVNMLVDNFAPTIHGMRDVKEGILCSAVSNGYSVRYDGTPQRDYSHVLVCADPGMAKSNLKHGLKAVVPRLVLSSGTGSSKAGLTAAAVKDDFAGGSWSIEAGALVLADCGGIALDEFDKFNKDDIRNLNDALSGCQFEIDKAGFHLKLWTRCFAVAFQNPKDGRFDMGAPIASQINIPPDTLSRFDLIFTLYDKIDEPRDMQVGGSVFDAWVGVEKEVSNEITIEDFQKYIAYAQCIQPNISTDLKPIFLEKYNNARRRSSDDRIAVTARYMEALIRLSKCEAKLCLSEEVTIDHLNRAVRLLDISLSQTCIDEDGRLDSDIIETGRSKTQRDKAKILIEIIKEISAEHKGVAPVGEVVLRAVDAGISGKDFESYIQNLKNSGDLFEPSKNYLKVV